MIVFGLVAAPRVYANASCLGKRISRLRKHLDSANASPVAYSIVYRLLPIVYQSALKIPFSTLSLGCDIYHIAHARLLLISKK